VGYKFIPKQLLGSVYTISELEDEFDNVQIGDEVNYEINGYSDWQVIGKDDYNGTIDVVSKTNTEDLTLEPNQTKEYYENKFQETANKYTDNNYAISARTVNSNDLDYFNYDNDFWLNNINDTNITTSQKTWQYDQSNVEPNYKMYVIPYVYIYNPNAPFINVRDVVEYSNNGVDRWIAIYAGEFGRSLKLIPETPIELVIDSVDDDINGKVNQIIESFNNNVKGYGNYFPSFSLDNLPNLIPNFLNQQTEKIYFIENSCWHKEDGKIIYNGCGPTYYYENGEFNQLNYRDTIYTEQGPKQLGYRPVVTLKVKEELQDKDKKEISNKLQVGDNVKYEAKGYKNWKALSVDNDLNTVDIISGGIVKNITLSGKEDWDNYEDIIQREVDLYKDGEQPKKATTVTSLHLKTLKEIDKSAMARYWILSKNTFVKNSLPYDGGKADLIYYYIGAVKNSENNKTDEAMLRNISIYADFRGSQEAVEYYNKDGYYTNEINSLSYTAGLRPVIKLKLDSVEKMNDKEAKEVEKSTTIQEKKYIQEQEAKNKNYKGPKTVDDTSSKGTKKDNNINNNSNKNKNITDKQEEKIIEKTVYKDRPLYKYGFYILLIICLIETILLIIPKKRK